MVELNSSRTLRKPPKWYWSVLLLLFAVVFFLFSIELVGGSLTRLGRETAQSILLVTSNPFVGLFIGLLTTALIQSSSTVTAMTVAVVASGYLGLSSAIPIVMGANVGTTLTSTLVSLGYITKKNQFRKAISAGSVHDFFNILLVVLLFPLEYYYGMLTRLSESLTEILSGMGITGGTELGFGGLSLTGLSDGFVAVLPNNFLTIIVALVLLFLSIKLISRIIYTQLIGESKDRLRRFVFHNPFKSFGWGTLITAGVQSSSITTSLMVPLVASGRVSLRNSFPFIMGANIGTTITALLAAVNKSDAAISLAIAHLLFNLIGVLVFLPFPFLRTLPVRIAYRFGALTLDSRLIGFSYIIFTFFLLPFTLIYINKSSIDSNRFIYEVNAMGEISSKAIVLNADKVKNINQYLIYESEKVNDQNSFFVPDTSFQTDSNREDFASFEDITNYGRSSGTDRFGDYTLRQVELGSSYMVGSDTLRGLILLEKIYLQQGEIKEVDLLVDPLQKILVKAEYYDSRGRMKKSERLRSIE